MHYEQGTGLISSFTLLYLVSKCTYYPENRGIDDQRGKVLKLTLNLRQLDFHGLNHFVSLIK